MCVWVRVEQSELLFALFYFFGARRGNVPRLLAKHRQSTNIVCKVRILLAQDRAG